MYNKLILQNNGNAFVVRFNWADHEIPTWLFEAEETLWNFIFWQAKKWKLDVVKKEKPEAPKVIPIEKVEIKKVEEVNEEKQEVEIKKEDAKKEIKKEIKWKV